MPAHRGGADGDGQIRGPGRRSNRFMPAVPDKVKEDIDDKMPLPGVLSFDRTDEGIGR